MTVSPPIAEVTGMVPRGARVTTILLVGRVSTSNRDDLCRVRNISAGGMRLETLAPVTIGEHVDVELKNGVTMRSEVVWVGAAEAGLRFIAPLDIAQVLAPPERPARTTGARTMRSPRLSARCPVALRHDGRIASAILMDVSQGGAQLQATGTAKIGDQVVLFIPGLGSHRATIRWIRDKGIGVSFAEKLGFADLAQWLASPDRFAPNPAPDLN